MTTVIQLLGKKGTAVYSVGPDETVFQALQKMSAANVGCLVVMDGERLVGVISERDYARNVVLRGRTSSTTPIWEIMNTKIIYAKPDQTVEECMAVMTDKRIRHLPVIDREQDKIVGVISIGDLVKSIISDQKFIIEQLEHFIQGQR